MRTEKDSLGEKQIPDEAYWGVQTQRAIENFPISGMKPYPAFVKATAHIKKAAAAVNMELGLLDREKGKAIIQAATEVIDGALQDHFVVDVYQAGAGTSHNMNTNEVIANRANEILGGKKGDHSLVHPNDHVNMGQSTNDVIPTAMRLSALSLSRDLLPALEQLERSFKKKGAEFGDIVKSGRTHLQDAVPLTLGQELSAYSTCLRKHKEKIGQSLEPLMELGIGGSAVGTGLNTHPRYRELMARELSRETGFTLRMSDDYFEAMQSMAPFSAVSSAMRNLAVDLTRIANDLRLLSSGPMVGLGEIKLPPVQPGSSIMPGKVNPVMAEMLNMVCFQVIGNDSAIMMASQAGQLELNVMMPVIAFNLIFSMQILTNSMKVFASRCVDGITVNREMCGAYAEKSIALVTALSPYIGYDKAAEVAKESLSTGKSIKEVVLEKKLLSLEEIEKILKPEHLTQPGIPGKGCPSAPSGARESAHQEEVKVTNPKK